MHAARAIEREEAGEFSFELVLDCRAHHPAGPEQPGLDGVGFDVEQRRGLLDAETLDVAQHEDGAEDVWQRVDRLLVEAGLTQGKRLTSYPSLTTDVRNSGGTWVDEEVVRDDAQGFPLVTSRVPDDLPAFLREIDGLLAR